MKAKASGTQSKDKSPPSLDSASDRVRLAKAMSRSIEIAARRRRDRLRHQAAELKFIFPTDDERRKLAKLADVKDVAKFGTHISHIILDTHLNAPLFKGLSAPEVRNKLNNVATRARDLAASLRELDADSEGSAARAGLQLELELSTVDEGDSIILLSEYLHLVQVLCQAAENVLSSVKSARGPKALSEASAFDLFFESLLMAAWQRGGCWTVYRKSDQTWKGTLLEALPILKKYLPQGFLPDEVGGRRVEHIRKKLQPHITKNSG
jgi:hypothetical protein